MSEHSDTKSASRLFDDLLEKTSAYQDKPFEEAIKEEAGQAFDDDTELPEMVERTDSAQAGNLKGTLPPDAKNSLVHLYRGGSVLMSENKERYDTLCKYEDHIRAHLADVYMEVIFDKKAGHIFTQILIPDDDDEAPARLVTAKPLSIYQSILLIVLRKYFQERETTGEQHIVVDLDRLESFMVPYLELSHSSRKDRERLKKAVTSMVDKRLLISIRGEEGRFQISPIIRNVVNAEFLESLLTEYQKMLGKSASESDAGT